MYQPKTTRLLSRASLVAAFGLLPALIPIANAQEVGIKRVMLTPSEMQWKPLPAQAGAKASDLIGSREQPGFYVQRVSYPANFINYPHSHPENRTYTVISGTLYVGFGSHLASSQLKALPPGSFWTEPANVNHFLVTRDEPVVFQITGIAPSGTTYVDPAHDPRLTKP